MPIPVGEHDYRDQQREHRDGGCETQASHWPRPTGAPVEGCPGSETYDQTGKGTREELHRRNSVGGRSRDLTSRRLACYAR